jgi:hypothetical protein
MTPFQPPIQYDKIRIALVQEVQKITGLVCIVEEPETPNNPRPDLPYFTIKFVGPATKVGDDSAQNILDQSNAPTTQWNRGGSRKLLVDFNSYGRSHEESYNYLTLLQSALELESVQSDLRQSEIAFWLNGNVNDLSALLNTGYEGRAQMHVEFGVASNMVEDLGAMESVTVQGAVQIENKVENTTQTIT